MRTKKWMAALCAFGAISLAACEAGEDAETMESEPVEAAETATAEIPPPGTYHLVGGEGFGEEGMPEDLVLEVGESEWHTTMGGEPAASGTYAFEGDTLRVVYEEGDCAGVTALYDWSWDGSRHTIEKIESAACEAAADRTVFELQTGDAGTPDTATGG